MIVEMQDQKKVSRQMEDWKHLPFRNVTIMIEKPLIINFNKKTIKIISRS